MRWEELHQLLRPRYGSFRSSVPESSAGVRAPEAGGEETWWQKLVRAVGVPLRRAARMAAEFCSWIRDAMDAVKRGFLKELTLVIYDDPEHDEVTKLRRTL